MGKKLRGKIRLMNGMVILSIVLAGCGIDETATVPLLETQTTQIQESITDEMITEPTDEKQTEPIDNETVTAEEQKDDLVTITISAAGDVTLGNYAGQDDAYSFNQTYDDEGSSYFFQNVKQVFEQDDLTIVNLEGPLTASTNLEERTYNMKGRPEYTAILTEGSVEAVSMGNNHRLDYGEEGSLDTVNALKQADICYAYETTTGIFEVKDIKIGMISVNEVSQGSAVESIIQEDIAKLEQEGIDLLIISCHWGEERAEVPEDYQVKLAKKCIDWGADLVLGHHPHVLQGIEVYKSKCIVYSLGNFCFGGNRNPEDKDTMIFQQTFSFYQNELQDSMDVMVIPCSISSVSERNNFQPTILTNEEQTRVLQKINMLSEAFQVQFDENGQYVKNKTQ